MDTHLDNGQSFVIFDQIEVNVPLIFTTAYDEYMVKAFKVNSIDYLLKPINYEELEEALNKYYKQQGIKKTSSLEIIKGMLDLALKK